MVDNVQLLSNTEIELAQAKQWATNKGATQTFIDNAKLYWKLCSNRGGINPAIAYVQYAKETGYGKFGGVLDETYYNPCGLKTNAGGSDDEPSAHKRFDCWEQGISAHIDHLGLYAGDTQYPKFSDEVSYSDGGDQYRPNGKTADPRHFPYLLNTCFTVLDLGGKWAPSPSYGTDLMKLYNEVLSTEFTPEEEKEEEKEEDIPNEELKLEVSNLKKEIEILKRTNDDLNADMVFTKLEIENINNMILRVKAFIETL